MPVTYSNDSATFCGHVSVEEAEILLSWIQQHPHPTVDLSACTHIHAASLQVLMAARLAVSAWPLDNDFKNWLTSAL